MSNSTHPVLVRPPQPSDEAGWRDLWAEYCSADTVSEEATRSTWQRLMTNRSGIGGLIAVTTQGEVVGFLLFVEHFCTWEVLPVCYVEDLYVAPMWRGRGYGVADKMAKQLLSKLAQGEWSRLYGITRATNIVAQKLYSAFAVGDDYKRYVVRPGTLPNGIYNVVQRGSHGDLWVTTGLAGAVASSPDKNSAGRFSAHEAHLIVARLGTNSQFQAVPAA